MVAEREGILVVDDENQNLRLMLAMLIPLGYEVILSRHLFNRITIEVI